MHRNRRFGGHVAKLTKMRTSFFLFLSLLFYANLSAQDSSHVKLSASLKLFLAEGSKDERYIRRVGNETMLPVFIEIGDNYSFAALGKSGVTIGTIAKNIATANIPLSQLVAIAALPGVKRIELPLLFQKTDTLANKLIGANRVLSGDSPLPRAFTGKGVLIGIIDDGIDITHPEFLDATGKTKLKTLWNMDYTGGTPPDGFHYGQVWNADSINAASLRYSNGQMTRMEMQRRFGYGFHGTSVTGLAAGNSGVAPDANIVSVALTAYADTLLRSDRIVDAISYIYSKAGESEKCVVNISLGLMPGAPHDGKSMVERAIDNFCEGKPNLLVCVSAGNNGNTWKHWGGFPIHADSTYGFFRCVYTGSLYFSIPKQYSNTLRISVTDSKLGNFGSPNISRDSIIFQTQYVRVSDLIQSATPVIVDGFFPNGNPSSRIVFTASHYNDDYDELILTVYEQTSTNTVLNDHLYRFIWKGTGTVHAWFPFFNMHPHFIFSQNPFPNDPTYRNSDNDYTTNIPSHAFTVLSSGAYNIRNCYVNIQNHVVNQYPKCQQAFFTSHGPTLDGRVKPDILTPGDNVLAPRSRMDTFLEHEFILSNDWSSFGGTSASSPITAGIAALIWEANPSFTRDSIINKIKSTAYNDAYTQSFGPAPNNVAGWGKADVFKALTGISTNYKPVCDQLLVCEGTPPVTNPPVPVEDFFKIFPNPANGMFYISYRSTTVLHVSVYNSMGQLVATDQLPSGELLSRPFDLQHLPSGVYYLRLNGIDHSFSKTILIMR